MEDANREKICDDFLDRMAKDEFDSSDLSDASPELKDYLKKTLDKHYYERPRKGFVNGFINGVLGPVPDKLVLVMAGKAVKSLMNIRVLAYATLATAIVLMLGLAYETPALAVSPFMWLLELVSPLGFWVTIIVGIVVFAEVLRAMFNNSSSSRDSVVGYKGFYELECAEAELQLRAGAENWSLPRRIASVLIGGITYNSIWITLFFPLASAITLIGVSAIYMIMYLAVRESSGSTMIATVQVAKFRASFGRFIYLYFIAALVASTFGSGVLHNLASMLHN